MEKDNTYGQLDGKLVIYEPVKKLVAFISHPSPSTLNYVVFIGGLTDGPLSVPYTIPLARSLCAHQFSLVQPTLSSSWKGFGTSSLRSDSEELLALLMYLIQYNQAKKILLMGHSTGCQDILFLFKFLKEMNTEEAKQVRAKICSVILQAPASDREYMENTMPQLKHTLGLAKDLIEAGKEHELLPINTYFVPITAYRYHSLASFQGDDDMFSISLPRDYVSKLFANVTASIHILFSEKDEYVPENVQSQITQFFTNLPNVKSFEYIPNANHNTSNLSSAQLNHFVHLITDYCIQEFN